MGFLFYKKERCYGSEILNACMSNQKKMIYGKKSVTRPPFVSHYAIIQGEMGLFLTFSVFELQKKWGRISNPLESVNRYYLYYMKAESPIQFSVVEFRQKVIGAGLNLFWGHLHYFSGGIWTFPLLSVTYASAPIAERAFFSHIVKLQPKPK